ncbi:hypothetical protein ACFE04_016258 [Oxalis oulophora]
MSLGCAFCPPGRNLPFYCSHKVALIRVQPFPENILQEQVSKPQDSKGFLRCKQSDPQFEKCVNKAANLAIPELVKGQPKFGLPVIDPLRITSLIINQGHGPVNIRLNFTNLDIIGLTGSSVTNLNGKVEIIIKVVSHLRTTESSQMNKTASRGYSLEKTLHTSTGSKIFLAIFEKLTSRTDIQKAQMSFKVTMRTPLNLIGQYSVEGKVLVLPIVGHGPCNLTLDKFEATITGHFSPTEKGGEIYWLLKDLNFDFTVTKLYMNLANLFNGDKALGTQMNIFLNENWKEILEELRPAFTTALTTIFRNMAQRFFEKVPLNQMFPKQ